MSDDTAKKSFTFGSLKDILEQLKHDGRIAFYTLKREDSRYIATVYAEAGEGTPDYENNIPNNIAKLNKTPNTFKFALFDSIHAALKEYGEDASNKVDLVIKTSVGDVSRDKVLKLLKNKKYGKKGFKDREGWKK